MNRAFITLYLFLVISVVVIGWGLNQIWDSLAPDQKVSPEIETIFYLVEQDAEKYSAEWLSSIPKDKRHLLQLEFLTLDDMAQSNAMQELTKGRIVTASTDDQLIWYKRIAGTNSVLMLSQKINHDQGSFLYNILLIIFYFGLALVIYLWVWPLSRDAKKLEQQTQSLGSHQVPDVLSISHRSTLYPLAQAFNKMIFRLRDLITSHHDMTNAVSHELRTPLARMKFALAMIDQEKLSERSQQQLKSLTLDISEMETLVNSLLFYAGFEQQTRKMQFTSGHIHDLLDNLQERFIRTHHHKYQLEIKDFSGNQLFSCEWKLLETALQNLLSNAARFAEKRILLEANVTDTEYQIHVDDDGPGIPIEERQRVLESFVRLYDEQNESQSSGFGLGLAIVNRIMQWHQGKVDVECSPTLGGARLILRWPKYTDEYTK